MTVRDANFGVRPAARLSATGTSQVTSAAPAWGLDAADTLEPGPRHR